MSFHSPISRRLDKINPGVPFQMKPKKLGVRVKSLKLFPYLISTVLMLASDINKVKISTCYRTPK